MKSYSYLESLEKFGINLGLDRIRLLLEKLENPQLKFKSIHIAGTNGKGSTACYIASILKEAGYKVGLYTSPHLLDWKERFKIDGKDISKKDFERGIRVVRHACAVPAGRQEGRHPDLDSRFRGNDNHRIILLCPTGKPLTQAKVKQLAKEKHLILVCGHYEGIDDRIDDYVDETISIGDYVLTGGELPAMVLIDAVARYIPGVVKEEKSVENDSFTNGLLDCPCYTRPEEFEGKRVPDVLLSGNHAEIEKWRKNEAARRTKDRRPDLLNG
ncbi:MAG: tRNA (guanosine(37)-N1)-methyltransferase TrmD [bacterium]